MTLTLIESIEAEIEKCREWLVHEFGDHMSIHNSLADLREGVLKATSSVEVTSDKEKTTEQETPEEQKEVTPEESKPPQS